MPEGVCRTFMNIMPNAQCRAMMNDPEIVDAICVAHDAMPTLLPDAFAVCVEEEQREAQAQSIELERRRKEQEELEQRIADREELEKIQQELEEAERFQASQIRQVNAAEITQLMIGRMTDLASRSQAGEAGGDLIESLTRSLRSFFDQTSSVDSDYLAKTATEYVSQMRDAEVQRIKRAVPDMRAAMVQIKHAGKFITHLPDAIQQILQSVKFNLEATPMRDLPDHPAEFEEEDCAGWGRNSRRAIFRNTSRDSISVGSKGDFLHQPHK